MGKNHDIVSCSSDNVGAGRAEGIVRRVFRDYPGRLAVRLCCLDAIVAAMCASRSAVTGDIE